MIERQYVEVCYLCLDFSIDTSDGIGGARVVQTGQGSGNGRMWLDELPVWLETRPGTLVTAVRPV